MSNLETNTTDLQSILNKVRNLPAAGGGSSVQPDWNQNDPDAADYIKNRPCGDIGKIYLIPEGTMTSEATVDEPPAAIYELPSLDGIDFDSPIHININGVEYERNFVKYEIDPGVYWYCFGNTPLMLGKGTNGDPFMGMVGITQNESGDIGYMAMIACIEANTSVPVSVWQDGFKTLDTKYLPKHLQCGETITGRVKDITWDGNLEGYEYQSLEMDGQTVYVVKMSDATPDIGYLQGGTITVMFPEGSQTIDINSDTLYDFRYEEFPMPFVMINEVAAVCFDTVNFMGVQLSKGIHFMTNGEIYVSELHLLLEYTISEIKKIDSKFIDLGWSPKPKITSRTPIVYETSDITTGWTFSELNIDNAENYDEYAITLDGIEYLCAPYITRDKMDGDFGFIGNLSLAHNYWPNTGESFLLLFSKSNTAFASIDTQPHTIKIDGLKVVYETIPEQCLPENIRKTAGLSVQYQKFTVDNTDMYAQQGAEMFNSPTNIAIGKFSHAEGNGTRALEEASHAEGFTTRASGRYSHAEGYNTTTSSLASHAEGYNTKASGNYGAHAEGYQTTASGNYGAHAEGSGTIASSAYQHVQGKYNVEDKENKYAHIVGNGDHSKRSNAHTLDWSGNAWFAGDVYVGGTSQNYTLKLSPVTEDTTEILPETTRIFSNSGYGQVDVTPNIDLVVGEKYDACWDGTWYRDLTACKIATETYIAGTVDGYSFGLLYNSSTKKYSVETNTAAAGETHTIKVVQSKGVTATIDNKPIPLATKAYVEALEKEIAELRTLVQQLTNS